MKAKTLVIKAFKKHNLKTPVFENFQSSFRITISSDKTYTNKKVTDNPNKAQIIKKKLWI